jgi:hypothetical protein
MLLAYFLLGSLVQALDKQFKAYQNKRKPGSQFGSSMVTGRESG